MKKNAFTIMELLVVVAIFLAMFAILGPFVRMARIRANRLQCADNLRKVSIGLHSYAADHNDAFPPGLKELYPNYVKSEAAFDCPAYKDIGTADRPDYAYRAGLTENSNVKNIIVEDIDGNHNKSGRNILRIDGSLEWSRSGR